MEWFFGDIVSMEFHFDQQSMYKNQVEFEQLNKFAFPMQFILFLSTLDSILSAMVFSVVKMVAKF